MMLCKYCTQYARKFGKLSSGHRTEKGQFSFQSQERQCQRMLKLPHNCTNLTNVQNEKAGLKLSIQETRIMASGPITFMANRCNGNSDRLYFGWAPKSLQVVTAATKLKDACSLEEKL